MNTKWCFKCSIYNCWLGDLLTVYAGNWQLKSLQQERACGWSWERGFPSGSMHELYCIVLLEYTKSNPAKRHKLFLNYRNDLQKNKKQNPGCLFAISEQIMSSTNRFSNTPNLGWVNLTEKIKHSVTPPAIHWTATSLDIYELFSRAAWHMFCWHNQAKKLQKNTWQ